MSITASGWRAGEWKSKSRYVYAECATCGWSTQGDTTRAAAKHARELKHAVVCTTERTVVFNHEPDA